MCGWSGGNRAASGRNAVLWGIVVVAATLDVVFTYYGLKTGLVELNPVVWWSVSTIGSGALPLLKGGALLLGVVGWLAVERPYRPLVPLILGAPWCLAAITNGSILLAQV